MSARIDFSDAFQEVPPVGYGDVVTPAPKRRKNSYDDLIEKHAAENNLDPDLIRAVMGQESGGNPSAVSPKGASGLMQLMPGTAQRFGVQNIHDPDQNIRGGAKYLRFLLDRFQGDVPKTLAGYNAGEGAVDKFGGIPPYRETQNYVRSITGRYKGSGYGGAAAPRIDFSDASQDELPTFTPPKTPVDFSDVPEPGIPRAQPQVAAAEMPIAATPTPERTDEFAPASPEYFQEQAKPSVVDTVSEQAVRLNQARRRSRRLRMIQRRRIQDQRRQTDLNAIESQGQIPDEITSIGQFRAAEDQPVVSMGELQRREGRTGASRTVGLAELKRADEEVARLQSAIGSLRERDNEAIQAESEAESSLREPIQSSVKTWLEEARAKGTPTPTPEQEKALVEQQTASVLESQLSGTTASEELARRERVSQMSTWEKTKENAKQFISAVAKAPADVLQAVSIAPTLLPSLADWTFGKFSGRRLLKEMDVFLKNQGLGGHPLYDPSANPLFKAGEASKKAVDAILQPNSDYAQEFLPQVANGLGQLLTQIGTGGVGVAMRAAPQVAKWSALALAGSQTGVQGYVQAREYGASVDEARLAGLLHALITAGTEKLPMDEFVDNLIKVKNITPGFRAYVKDVGRSMASGSLKEFGQEASEDLGQGLVDTAVYGAPAPQEGRLTRAGRAGLVGAGTGGAAGGLTAASGRLRSQTVPESQSTIEAQQESAANPDSPRIAVFYPAGTSAPEQVKGTARIILSEPSGILDVDRASAKEIGLVKPKDIREFVAENGIEPLIGKVAPVSDTSQGATLRTEDASGRELSTSVVTSPETAEAQAAVDRAQFPQTARQEVLPAQEAAQRRIDDVSGSKPEPPASAEESTLPSSVISPLRPEVRAHLWELSDRATRGEKLSADEKWAFERYGARLQRIKWLSPVEAVTLDSTDYHHWKSASNRKSGEIEDAEQLRAKARVSPDDVPAPTVAIPERKPAGNSEAPVPRIDFSDAATEVKSEKVRTPKRRTVQNLEADSGMAAANETSLREDNANASIPAGTESEQALPSVADGSGVEATAVQPDAETVLIARHSDPNIDGGEIVGRTSDGKYKVKNNGGGISIMQDPRRAGNREGAVQRVRRGLQIQPKEAVGEAQKSTQAETAIPEYKGRGVDVGTSTERSGSDDKTYSYPTTQSIGSAVPASVAPEGKTYEVPWADGRGVQYFDNLEAANRFREDKLKSDDEPGEPKLIDTPKGARVKSEYVPTQQEAEPSVRTDTPAITEQGQQPESVSLEPQERRRLIKQLGGPKTQTRLGRASRLSDEDLRTLTQEKIDKTAERKPRKQPAPDPTKHSLSRFVQLLGGMRLTSGEDHLRGEYKRLSPKESRVIGLTNKNSDFAVEQMAVRAWEDGYMRDVWPDVADVNPAGFLEAIASDAAGSERRYSTANDITQDEVEQLTSEQKEEFDAELRYLADPRVVELLKEVENGHEDEGLREELYIAASNHGLPDEAVGSHLQYARDEWTERQSLPETRPESDTEEDTSFDFTDEVSEPARRKLEDYYQPEQAGLGFAQSEGGLFAEGGATAYQEPEWMRGNKSREAEEARGYARRQAEHARLEGLLGKDNLSALSGLTEEDSTVRPLASQILKNAERVNVDSLADVITALKQLDRLRSQDKVVSDYVNQPQMFGERELTPEQEQILSEIDRTNKLPEGLIRAKEKQDGPDLFDSPLKMSAAWHGSPHRFDKFSTEHIGSGEGAQSYGHGLYFAGRQEIAKYYRDNLAGKPNVVVMARGEDARNNATTVNERSLLNMIAAEAETRGTLYTPSVLPLVRQRIKQQMADAQKLADPNLPPTSVWNKFISDSREMLRRLDQLEREGVELEHQQRGALYHVELAPQEDEYLLWDKPLSEQSAKVKKALKGLGRDVKGLRTEVGNSLAADDSGEELYRLLSGEYPWNTEGYGSPRDASQSLHSLGIRGIKYLDQNSRSQGEGSYNYVIFSDEDVEIKEVLKMARLNRLREVGNAADLVSGITQSRDGNLLTVNAEGQEFLRRAFEQNAINRGETGGPEESSFDGVFLDPKQMRETVKTLRAAAQDMKEKGYSEDEIKSVNELAQNLIDAARAGKGTSVIKFVDAPESAVPHEFFHEGSFKGSEGRALEDRHARIDELENHDAVKAWREFYKDNPEYQNASRGVAVEETAATIAGGDYAKLGLSEDQATDYLTQWFDSYIERNGEQSVEEFQRQREETKRIIERAKARFSDSGQTERANRPADGNLRQGEGVESRGSPEGDTEASSGKGEVARRSLPSTLRNKGLQAADELYERYTNKASIADAKALFQKLGFEGAENLLMSGQALGAEHMALSEILQRTLLTAASEVSETNPQRAAELRERQQLIASFISAAATRSGQFIQAAQATASSVEDVMMAAQRMAKERGRKLSPKEARMIHEAGEGLERATASLEVIASEVSDKRAEAEANKEVIARAEEGALTEKEIENLRKRLANLRAKEKTREAKIAALDEQMPVRPRRAKSRVPVKQQAIDILAASESDLMARVRSMLGGSPLKMVAGEKGAARLDDAISRLDNLRVAKEMEGAKKDARTIWLATGWEKGGDGKWKTEVDDSPSVARNMFSSMKKNAKVPMPFEYDRFWYRKTGEGQYDVSLRRKDAKSTTQDFLRYKDVTLYDIGDISPVVEQAIREGQGEEELGLDDNYDEITEKHVRASGRIVNNGVYLPALINHPELFRAYPKLENVPVAFDAQLHPFKGHANGLVGETQDGGLIIMLSPHPKDSEIKSTLHHEIQHVIQRLEGFAKGGSPNAFYSPEEAKKAAQEVNDEYKKKWEKIEASDAYQRRLREILSAEPAVINPRDGKPSEALRRQEAKAKAADEFGFWGHDRKRREDVDAAFRGEFAFDRYKRLGGEVEARNVQTRLNMTLQERAQKTLAETEDISRDSQIYLSQAIGSQQNILKSAQPAIRPLSDETISKLAQLGALKLLRSDRSKYTVSDFKREMIKEFGPSLRPEINRIHAESVRVMRETLRQARFERAIESIAAREGNEDLSREELEAIAATEREEKRRASLVRAEHEKVANEFGKPEKPTLREVVKTAGQAEKRLAREAFRKAQALVRGTARKASQGYQRSVEGVDVGSRALAQAIGRNAKSDIEAISAAKLSLPNMTPGRFVREMKAELNMDGEAAREAFKRGGAVLESARKEINQSRQIAAALKTQAARSAKELDQALASLQEARKARMTAQRQVAAQFQALKKGRARVAAEEVWRATKGIPISIMASGDISGIFNQGGIAVWMHPTMLPEFATATIKSWSDTQFAHLQDAIERDADFSLMQRMKIDFAFAGGVDKGEEMFQGADVLQKVPVVKQTVGKLVVKSDQSFGGGLDWLRASLAKMIVTKLREKGVTYKDNQNTYERMGAYVNIITGRGDIGQHNTKVIKAILGVSKLIGFAPRYRVSRLQFLTMPLTPSFYQNVHPVARRIILRDLASYYGKMGGLMIALTLLGYAGIASTSFDPDDDDFLKMKIGKLRLDLTGGNQSAARFVSRLLSEGYRGLTGQVTGEMASKQIGKVTLDWLSNGADPRASLAKDWWTGQDFKGQPFHWGGLDGAIATRLMPMSWNAAANTALDEGAKYGAAQLPLDMTGIKASVYPDRPDEPKTTAEKLAVRFAQRDYGNMKPLDEETKRKLNGLKIRARDGEDVSAEVAPFLEDGLITEGHAESIIEAKDQTFLQDKFRQLPLEDARHVLKYATPEEKRSLEGIMRDKELAYAEKKAKEEQRRLNPERTMILKERAKKAQRTKKARRELRYGEAVNSNAQ